MTKIVLVWWVITTAGEITEPVEWSGWRTMEECETALESFTEPNPSMNTFNYGIAGYCVEVPK